MKWYYVVTLKKEINIGNMSRTTHMSHLQKIKYQEISTFSCNNPITSLLEKQIEVENKSQDNKTQTSKKQVDIDTTM